MSAGIGERAIPLVPWTRSEIIGRQQEPAFPQIVDHLHQSWGDATQASSGGLLASTQDWQIKVDLGWKFKFPENTATTLHHPDKWLTLESTNDWWVVPAGTHVSWKDWIEEANQRKWAKYAGLSMEWSTNGWRAHCESVEAWCQGFAVIENTHTQPVRVKGLQYCGQATKNIMEAAVKASQSSAPLGQVED